MKRFILFALFVFISVSPAFATPSWETGIPDVDNVPSADIDDMQDNNAYLEDFIENHFFYLPSTSTTKDGWNVADPSAALFIGPISQTYDTTPDAITGRATVKGDLRAYGANMIPLIYDGSAWKFSANYLKNYATGDLPTCDATSLGLIAFDTTLDDVYACKSDSGSYTWIKAGTDPTAGVDTLVGDSGATVAGAVTIAGGNGITTAKGTGNTITVNAANTDATITTASITTTYCIDMVLDHEQVFNLTLTGNCAFTVCNIPSAHSVCVNAIMTTSSTDKTLSFDTDWKWIGASPTTLTAGTYGLLSLMNVGSAETDIIAIYRELGDGS